MKRSNQILIAIVAVFAVCSISILSCNKDSKVKDNKPTADKLAAGVGILAVDSACFTNSGSASSTGTPGTYSSWTTTTLTLATGVTVQFEGTLGSFIRATSSNTYIGTIHEDSTCYTWSAIYPNIQVKNTTFNIGTAPSGGTTLTGPCNVVGAIGTIPGTAGSDYFNGGYYTYNVSTHAFDVTRAVVVYVSSGTNGCSIVTPDGLTSAAYIIWVSTIISNNTGTAGTVKYRWYKIV